MKPQDPLPPEDAVWKLLGQSRKVDVRPNFVADVIREARQTPQDRGFWAKIRGWVADAFEVTHRWRPPSFHRLGRFE